jgi:hypothetical protein
MGGLIWPSRLRSGSFFHSAADVDDIVGDDPATGPAGHSDIALVAAAAQAMSSFDDADAPLASGAPFLAVAEPPLFLLTFTFEVFAPSTGVKSRCSRLARTSRSNTASTASACAIQAVAKIAHFGAAA